MNLEQDARLSVRPSPNTLGYILSCIGIKQKIQKICDYLIHWNLTPFYWKIMRCSLIMLKHSYGTFKPAMSFYFLAKITAVSSREFHLVFELDMNVLQREKQTPNCSVQHVVLAISDIISCITDHVYKGRHCVKSLNTFPQFQHNLFVLFMQFFFRDSHQKSSCLPRTGVRVSRH